MGFSSFVSVPLDEKISIESRDAFYYLKKKQKTKVGKNCIGIFSNVHFISKMRHMQSHTGSMH